MNREEIQKIILQVLSEYKKTVLELPLDIPVEVSARHVHLSKGDVEKLFGVGAKLTPKRTLSQPGQYLCEERVSIVTSKGRLENVAVLGPERPATQVEISMTDSRELGIKAPLRMSGDLTGAADVYLVGPNGMMDAKESTIIAKAHIHIPLDDAEKFGIIDGQRVDVTIPGERSITFNNIICRVGQTAGLAMHIDFDEANACMLPAGTVAKMTVCRNRAASMNIESVMCEKSVEATETVTDFDGKLITEAKAREIAGKTKILSLQKGVIITPSAKDVFNHNGVELRWQGGNKV